MKEELCSGINHPWQIKPPIIVLKNGDHRVRLVCARCGGLRYDTRSPSGGVLRGRSYDHSEAYDKFLKDSKGTNRRSAAWISVIAETKEKVKDEGNKISLRLVHRAKKGRGSNARPRKRAERRSSHA